MSFYRFSQVSGRLTPSTQFSSVVPQGLTPANKLKPAAEVRTNYPDMFRFRSTFNLTKMAKATQASTTAAHGTALPTEFTATGFPKFPPGTKIGKNMVMGQYGPYDAKIRAMQELFQKDPSTPVYLTKGAIDSIIFRATFASLGVGTVYCLYLLYSIPG